MLSTTISAATLIHLKKHTYGERQVRTKRGKYLSEYLISKSKSKYKNSAKLFNSNIIISAIFKFLSLLIS